MNKKHTIFKMFLVPLVAIMLIQGLLTIGTLLLRRTMGMIQDYSVGMMAKIVENRKFILENEMTQRWSAIYSEGYAIDGMLASYLAENNMTLEQLLSDETRCQELLAMVFPECLNALQSNMTSGVFLVLTDGDMGRDGEFNGFFIRDSAPAIKSINGTDMLLERGGKELSRKYNVPFGARWSTRFHMSGMGNREADRFFYEPWRAGEENPDADMEDLGYWSKPFILEDDSGDSHEMITYSVPLRHAGKVYAVLGIEVSTLYLYDYMPVSELNGSQQSGYMLANDNGDGSYAIISGKGVLHGAAVSGGETFYLDKTEYDKLLKMRGVKSGSQGIYAVVYPLKLYNKFAPYDNTDWVLVGLNVDEELFGMGRRIYMWLGIAILIGLAFGVAGIYFIVRHLTKPIKDLMACIGSEKGGLSEFKVSGIREIDALYDKICDLTARQKKSENKLLEEKERYRIAVESTNDAFFSYDLASRRIEVVNDHKMNGIWKSGDGMIDLELVDFEDRSTVTGFFDDIPDEASLEFRMKLPGQENYTWLGLYGKVFCDADGNRYKLMGSIRDIQKLKEQEMQQLARLTMDGVTGVYAYKAGMEKLERRRRNHHEGTMALLHFANMRRMSEANGIVFTDLILEQAGEVIRQSGNAIVFRLNISEFVIWLENTARAQAEEYAKRLIDGLTGLFEGSTINLDVRMGLVQTMYGHSDEVFMQRAKYAEKMVQENSAVRYIFYEDLPEHDARDLEPVKASRIVSNDYGEESSLSLMALNLFGRGADLSAQMLLILGKIGRRYGATDVMATTVRHDFCATYLEYQWHSDGNPGSNTVNQYTQEEWNAFQKWLGTARVQPFTSEKSGDEAVQKFLNVSEGQIGVMLSLYDSGSYMGNVCIVGIPADKINDPGERQKLKNIGSVIQSQLNQQQHDLASKAKSEFLSRMSHEIRTPMNGIIGMTAIAMQENQSMERILDCLGKIQGSSNYLLGLINDVLDMSKIESGKMRLEPVNFDIQEMTDTIMEVVRPQVEAKKIEFVQDIQIANRWFMADRMRISQVLINLLGNAVKFTPEHGRVTLVMHETDGGGDGRSNVRFEVRDTGMGISKENQKKVFRSFEQVEGASSVSKQKGTGLGLSISSRLIQLMGSAIELESEPGEGSRFYFALTMDHGRSEDGEDSADERVSFEGYRVLIVEDNELNVEIAQYLLEDYGFEVECVYDGLQAVEKIRGTEPGRYDVILMDIMMPVMDGLDATRAIRAMDRADCRTVPIIAMSANAFDDDLKKSVECGMNGHLSKPVEVDKVYRTLRDVLMRK